MSRSSSYRDHVVDCQNVRIEPQRPPPTTNTTRIFAMSFVAVATDRFDEVVMFYGDVLRFPIVREWDRPNGRGRVFDLRGLKLEVIDAQREANAIQPIGDRVHLVIEVSDIDAAYRMLPIMTDAPSSTSWGARTFRVTDPDGLAVWFLEWSPSNLGK